MILCLIEEEDLCLTIKKESVLGVILKVFILIKDGRAVDHKIAIISLEEENNNIKTEMTDTKIGTNRDMKRSQLISIKDIRRLIMITIKDRLQGEH